MTSNNASVSRHPGLFHRASIGESAFGLLGGPFAWFAQLCAGYALSSWPCFPQDQRRLMPMDGYEWTWMAVVVISIVAFAIALAACIVSWRIFRRVRNKHGDHDSAYEFGAGRTRFLALWGTVAGGGFAVAVAFTAIALRLLPRCAG